MLREKEHKRECVNNQLSLFSFLLVLLAINPARFYTLNKNSSLQCKWQQQQAVRIITLAVLGHRLTLLFLQAGKIK